jgi:hypothetical protein
MAQKAGRVWRAPALIPLVVGLLSAFVAYGRWRLAPHRASSHRSVLQPDR